MSVNPCYISNKNDIRFVSYTKNINNHAAYRLHAKDKITLLNKIIVILNNYDIIDIEDRTIYIEQIGEEKILEIERFTFNIYITQIIFDILSNMWF